MILLQAQAQAQENRKSERVETLEMEMAKKKIGAYGQPRVHYGINSRSFSRFLSCCILVKVTIYKYKQRPSEIRPFIMPRFNINIYSK